MHRNAYLDGYVWHELYKFALGVPVVSYFRGKQEYIESTMRNLQVNRPIYHS